MNEIYPFLFASLALILSSSISSLVRTGKHSRTCYEFSFLHTLSKTHAWPACLCMLLPLLKRPFSICQRHVFHTCLFLTSSLLLTCLLPYEHHTSSTPMPHSFIIYIVAYRVVYSLASFCSLITRLLFAQHHNEMIRNQSTTNSTVDN